jgi:hypothetical protein
MLYCYVSVCAKVNAVKKLCMPYINSDYFIPIEMPLLGNTK